MATTTGLTSALMTSVTAWGGGSMWRIWSARREPARCPGLARIQALHHLRDRHPRFPSAVHWTTPGQDGTGVWYWPDVWRWARWSGRSDFADLGPLRTPGTHASRHIDVGHLVGTSRSPQGRICSSSQGGHLLSQSDATFPAPVFVSNGGRWGTRLWAWPDVRRWAVRLPGPGLRRPGAERTGDAENHENRLHGFG